jgi:hypothetical protein
MEILQKDINGNYIKVIDEKTKSKAPPREIQQKVYKDISLNDVICDESATNESILINRILQQKLKYGGLKLQAQRNAFNRILCNEIDIKRGKKLSAIATRDSMLAFFELELSNQCEKRNY